MVDLLKAEDKKRGVESVERKLSPVGFNAFAIIGILVILPFSTAFITNLTSQSDDSEFIDLVGDGTNIRANGQGIGGHNTHMNWIDIGDNYSSIYPDITPSMSIEDFADCYEQIQNFAFYSLNPEYNVAQRAVCGNFGMMIDPNNSPGVIENFNGGNYLVTDQTHSFLNGVSPFVGDTSTNYAFSVEQSIFNSANQVKDISAFQVKMVQSSTFFDCSNAPLGNITFDYSITFVHKTEIFQMTHFETIEYNDWNTIKFDGFEFDDNNLITAFSPFHQGTKCYIGLNIDFNFDSLQALELADWINSNGNDITNISAIVEINNLGSPDTQSGRVENIPLPFSGTGYYLQTYGAKYVSATQVNFFLKGGAMVMGIALFLLAIASTPYWDPFMNLFQGRI
jgi:hypothetical protein